MIPEELKNFRPHNHAEVDRLMEDYFRQRPQDEEEVRRHKTAESSGLLRHWVSSGAAAQNEDASESTTSSPTQEFPRWVVAATEREKMRSSEETSPGARPDPVDSTAGRLEEREARSRLPDPSKPDVKREPMRSLKSPKIDSGADDLAPKGEHEDTTDDPELDRLLAGLLSEATLEGSLRPTASCERPVPAASFADASACDSAEKAKIDEPAHGTPTTEPSGPIARVDALTTESAGLDRFPVADLVDLLEPCDPVCELAALCRDLHVHRDYHAVRTRYCQLSICMNVQGAMAPASRSRPRVERPLGDPLHMLLHRDQLVIDYHWCHTRRMLLSPTDADHAHLLDLDSEFDFAAAWLLTGKKQKRAYRAAEALCLTPLQQCQTMTLHSQELAQRVGQIQGEYRRSKGSAHSPFAKATAEIGKWVERNHRIKAEKLSYERLWLAQAMLGADGTVQAIAELHSLMLGESPLHRKTIADKLKTLNRNVDVVLKPTSTP